MRLIKDTSAELFLTYARCRYDDGSYVTGTWNHGIRHGPFTFDTNKQGSEVSYLEGEYKDDCLEGLVRLQWKDASWSEGFYKGGVLHGFARRFDSDKQLTFVGMYRWFELYSSSFNIHIACIEMGNHLEPAGSCSVGEDAWSAEWTRMGS